MSDISLLLDELEERMMKTEESLQHQFGAIRTGKASPALVENITVEYYGTQSRIRDIAGISAPEPRLLVIQPWEASLIKEIEKAIQKSDLGLNPSNDGKIIRLIFPELNEERRKELTKKARKDAEDAKVAVRSIRRDAIEQVKKLKKDSLITEDDQRKAEEDAQKLTDKAIKEIDTIAAAKEKEIMEV